MNYGELQTAVLQRLNLGTDDPAAAAVGTLVNEAVQMVAAAHPGGWPWLHATVDWTTTSGTAAYTFATMSSTSTIAKVYSVRATISDTYRDLDPIGAVEAATNYVSASGTGAPEVFRTEGETVTLYPTPDGAYTLTARVLLGEAELVGDSEEPACPVRYQPAIVAAALTVYYELLQDTARSQAAASRYDGWIARMQRQSYEQFPLPGVRVRPGF